MTDYGTTLWIIAGIFSCLIFTLSDREWVRGMELVDAMMLLLLYICFVIMGPIGLIMLLIAQSLVFLSNLGR
jgi:hypothetical protein